MASTAQSDKMSCSTDHKALQGLLTADHILYGIAISSKKRLLEELAGLLSQQKTALDKDTVCRTLTERERLGSTGIGGGIALPHGRLNGINECIAAAIRLKEPLGFDAPDEQPICLAIALLVPPDAAKQHLQILAELARLFHDANRRDEILKAPDTATLVTLLA
jgi:PTS system nitrogen regulatory IIA component